MSRSKPLPIVSDELVRLLVMSQPIPEKLIVDLANALEGPRFIDRKYAGHPGRVTPILWETLKLIAAGYSEPRIARELGVSRAAVNDRTKRLLAIFDARNRMELVVRCYRERIM